MAPTFQIAGFTFVSYATLVALALLVAVGISLAFGPRLGVSRRKVPAMAVVAIAFGLVGAVVPDRLHYSTLAVRLGLATLGVSGLAVQPALILGALALAVAASLSRVTVSAALDLGAPAAAAAISVGRVGCLLAGCCAGRPTLFPIALVFEDFASSARPIGVPLHATQVYESVACAAIAVYLLAVRMSRRRFRGQLFLEFVLLYSMQRFLNEFLRASRWRVEGAALSVPQLLSLAALVVAGVIYARALVVQRSIPANQTRPRNAARGRHPGCAGPAR